MNLLLFLQLFWTCMNQPHQAFTLPKVLRDQGYTIWWHDEFEERILNPTKWRLLVKGRYGDAVHRLDQVKFLQPGCVSIVAEKKGDSVYTAMIHTEGLMETRYGYFECRAKLTHIKGLWPAFWLQSRSNSDHGQPATHGVEIDIFEYFRHVQERQVSHSLHWGGYGATHQVSGPVYSDLVETADGFHTFGLEWTPDKYAVFVDGKMTHEVKAYISQVPQSVLLSVEVNAAVAGPLEKDKLPTAFVVDYVRIFKKRSAD